ncbi:Bardet-Biedl syndrome 2 protein homolog [Sergentomyia squamirostris]
MKGTVKPVFSFNLSHKTVEKKVCIGKYDGTHSCLTAVTNSDKVVIHSPHRRSGIANSRVSWSNVHHDIASLTLSQQITAIECGKLNPSDEKEVLIIGSPTHILAYNIEENMDLFYKEIPEGIQTLCIGFIGMVQVPVVVTAGQGGLRAFDSTGTEHLWLITGCNCLTLVLFDVDKDGHNEILIGSQDSMIKIYKQDTLLYEFTENGMIVDLMRPGHFAYASDNGTVGVYEKNLRLWRIKSKHKPTSVIDYDFLGMGTSQLLTGWDNGKMDIRDISTGSVLFKIYLSVGITKLLKSDYRGIGKIDLICCTVDGEVRGYTTSKINIAAINVMEQEQITELFNIKHALMLELQHYESNLKYNMASKSQQMEEFSDTPSDIGVIPANTRLQIGIATDIENNKSSPSIEISICTNNSTIIRAVIIFAEGLFSGETLIVHPHKVNVSKLSIPVKAPKDIQYDIHIKALIGFANSQQFHVFELTRQLPKFAMYALPKTVTGSPKSTEFFSTLAKHRSSGENCVEFHIDERIQRICIWINQNFLLPADIEAQSATSGKETRGGSLKLQLIALRKLTDICMEFNENGNVILHTPELEMAGNFIKSLSEFLDINNLKTVAKFPEITKQLKELFEKLNGLQETQQKLLVEQNEKIAAIKNLSVRLTDARIHDHKLLVKYSNDLMTLHEDLLTNFVIRLKNANELQLAIKTINELLQHGAKLRIGKSAALVMKHFKEAVKNNNIETIVKLFETGDI